MNLVVFLDQFPFGFGEAFFENELPFLEKKFDEITLMTNGKGELTRTLSGKVKVIALREKSLILKSVFGIRAVFKAFFSKIARQEIKSLGIKNLTIFRMAMIVLYFYHEGAINYEIDKKVSKDKKTIFYSFWMNEAAFSISTKNYPFVIGKISRTHGYDLYFDRNRAKYLPFRKSIYQGMDQIHFLTDSAKHYYIETYGSLVELKETEKKLKISYLGVTENQSSYHQENSDVFRIVSCAFVRAVKRFDLIIDSIAQINPELKVHWTQIGEGVDLEKTKDYASKVFADKKNISFDFLGNLKNVDVRKNLAESSYDLFINLSDSEGVPVSIMEAMACGIPVLARNVGGNSEIVTNKNGRLIDEQLTSSDIAQVLEELIEKNKVNQLLEEREEAFKTWKLKYNATTNYEKFVKNMKSDFKCE